MDHVALAYSMGSYCRLRNGDYHHVVAVVKLVKNLGLNIKAATEKQNRSLQSAPKDNGSHIKNAKKDFAEYARVMRK